MSKLNESDVRLNAFFASLQEDLNDKQTTDAQKAFAVQRQAARMRKRAAFNDRNLRPKAIADFISINRLVGSNVVELESDIVIEASRYIEHILWRYMTAFSQDNIQETLDPDTLLAFWKFGPGASNGIRGTHTAEKISQSMTATILGAPYVVALRKSNTYFRLFDESNGNSGVVEVKGSRLATVPKNETTMRTIAIEPSGNMALQLAAGKVLEGALRMAGLDIQTQQPKNKLMAKRGSISGDFATLDLKSASDMFSLDLIRLLMPPKWFKFLCEIRSESIELDDEVQLKLNMMSTMGNGFTFPLMTLCLTSLIYAYRRLAGGPNLYIDWKRTCVYGDDIIVPSNEYERCCQVIQQAGLIVNHDKSYHSGAFRESCGGDFFEGYDVTPFYVKTLDNDAAVYVAINQVLGWSARHSLLLHRTLALLRGFLETGPYFVPEWYSPDQGVLTSQVPRRFKYLSVLPTRVKAKDNIFSMMLAVGGFVEAGDGPHMFFTPRQFKTRYVVRKARLPKGYLDGSDPVTRSDSVSNYISSYTFLLS